MTEEFGCKAYPPITKSLSQRLYEMAEDLEKEQNENERLNGRVDALQKKLEESCDALRKYRSIIDEFFSKAEIEGVK